MDRDLCGRSTCSATQTVIKHLETLLAELVCGDDARAEAAMHKLIDLGAKTLPALRDLAADPDPDRRWWAISTMAQIADADLDIFLVALKDEDLEIQQTAVLGLTERPHPKSVSVLIELLPSPNSILRTLAMNALIAIGKDATNGLLAFLQEYQAQDTARINAVRALANIADYKAIPALMAALEEDSALIRHWAEEGLEKLGLDMVYMKLE